MTKQHKTLIKTISFVLAILTLFNIVSTSFVYAVSTQPEKISPKKLISADIGEIPDKLPKQKLELKSKRTEYSTRYLNPDGSFTEEIFLDAKYYKDSDNQWKEIDNNLIESTKNANKLENKANKFKVSFSKQTGKEEIASIEKNDMSIGLIPVDASSVNSSV
ncbi:MAG: hypothetical protein AB7V48_18310, partial [Sedimentibacter sp.]